MRTQLNWVTLIVICSLGGSQAFAVTGTSGSGSNPPSCPKGEVWNSSTEKCEKSTSLDDKALYDQGRDLALAGRYAEALTALEAIKNQNDAMVLTMIGYSKRKLGDYEAGVALYERALAIEPNNPNTHEYLGEAYAENGKAELAKAELAKLSAICGTSCEQYQDLAKVIEGKSDD